MALRKWAAGQVLLLNATYEPMRVIPLQRAVCLLLAGRAEVTHSSAAPLRSAHQVMDTPVVVRLTSYVYVPRRDVRPLSRAALLARDNHRCQYCGRRGSTIDHVVPRSRGGQHIWTNVVIACDRCNFRKADRLLAEIGWVLRRRPAAPTDSQWVLRGVTTVHMAWSPYLQLDQDHMQLQAV